MATDPQPDAPDPTKVDAAAYEGDDGLDLDRLHAENRRDPYKFTWAGQQWELPNVYDLPTNLIPYLGKEDLGVDDILTVVTSAIGPDQWTALNNTRPLPITVTITLFNSWLTWCGVDRGEASNSAGSSGSTAESSKRTSRGSTASASRRLSTAGRKTAARRGNS